MLKNNLDPEVAERPQDLVVYGGIGRAAAQLGLLRPDRRRAEGARATTRRCWSSRASRSGVFKTHEDAPRVLLANSNLVPQVGHLGALQRARPQGPRSMYGQMTAGSWIYIGTPGHRAGHLRDLRRGRPPALRQRPRGRAGSSPAASAAWAARSRWPPRWRARVSLNVEVDQQRASTSACAPRYVDEQARRASTTRSSSIEQHATRRQAVSIALLRQRRRGPARNCVKRARRAAPTSSPTRPRRTTRCNGYLPAGWTRRAMARAAATDESQPARASKAARAVDAPCTCEAMLDVPGRGHPDVSTTATTSAPGGLRRGRRRTRSTSRASCRPTSARCSARARARSAGSRCRATRRTSPRPTRKVNELFPDERAHCTAGSTWRASASASRACRRASAGSACGERHKARPGLQRDGAQRRAQGADRDRPRPPRHRLGRQRPTARPRR